MARPAPSARDSNLAHNPETVGKAAARLNRTREQQLRRFMGTRSGRKIHYGHVLGAALELIRLPGPLDGVLSRV